MWQDLSQSELSLSQQLSEFYDTLLSSWHSQLQWSSQVRNTHPHTGPPSEIPPRYQSNEGNIIANASVRSTQVFKNPYEVVTVLLIQTLAAMVPSIPVCLSTALERTAQEQRLDSLLELHGATTTFGHSLEAAMLPHLGAFSGTGRRTREVS